MDSDARISSRKRIGDLLPEMKTGTTVFHFSIKLDEKRPLNYNHEYQIVFIEPNDGSYVFGIQLGGSCC